MSYKQNHTVHALWRLAFSLGKSLPVPMHCSLLLLNNIPTWMCHSLFKRSFTAGHLGYFQLSAITNKAAVNTWEELFVWTWVFMSLGKYCVVQLLGCTSGLCLVFLRNCQSVSPSRWQLLFLVSFHPSRDTLQIQQMYRVLPFFLNTVS